MLAEMRINIFQEQLNTTFDVVDAACSLILVQVGIHAQTDKHEAFSLFFDGPATPFLPQSTYTLRQAALGDADMFLVPVGRKGDGFQYEAVFNHVF